jgi:hypothetical protein
MATVLDGWTHWVLGFVFVYLVATIAPSHKRIAAIVAAACVVLMAGVIIGMAVTAADYRALPTMALVLGGAVVSCVVLHRRDAYESA